MMQAESGNTARAPKRQMLNPKRHQGRGRCTINDDEVLLF
jgi:hypothetical protein